MTDLVRKVTLGRIKLKKFPEFTPGDTVGVYVRVKEGEKERVQLYRGVCIKIQGSGLGRSFTVRKISSGVGVERTFPFASPAVDRVEVFTHGKVRRGKLFYLRRLKGRAARLDSDVATRDEERFTMVEEGEAIAAADQLPEAQAPAPAPAAEETKVEAKTEEKA